MQRAHARSRVRHRPQHERDPAVRRIEPGTLVASLTCLWIDVGLLVVDGQNMVGLVTWPFAGLMIAILAFRVVSVWRIRRRPRAARTPT